MLKLTLVTVGDLPRGSYEEIGTELKKPLQKYIDLEYRIVRDPVQVLHNLKAGTFLIILDALGKHLTSEQLATKLGVFEDEGRHVTVIIGGPFGLSAEIKSRADLLLSLSPMTTTHDLAHLFLLEQLFRAFTILRGTGYAK